MKKILLLIITLFFALPIIASATTTVPWQTTNGQKIFPVNINGISPFQIYLNSLPAIISTSSNSYFVTGSVPLPTFNGANDVCFITGSCASLTTAQNTIIIGSGGGAALTTQSGNVGLGLNVLKLAVSAANTSVGFLSCATVTTGSSDSCFGFGADVLDGSFSNASAFGEGALAGQSNFFALGGEAPDNVKVGIATSTSWRTADLTINTLAGEDGIAIGSTTMEFLVDRNGRVGIGTSSPSDFLSVVGGLFVTASSTHMNGINLTAGCFSINNACVGGSGGGGSGTVNSGLLGQAAYYAANGTAVSGTSTVFINTTSNVGVGSTTPWGKLSIGTFNQPTTTPSFVIASSSTGIATTTQFVVTNGHVGVGSQPATNGLLKVSNGANINIVIGDACLNSGNYSGIAFGVSDFSGCTNYSFLGDGTDSFFNAPGVSGTLYFRVSSATKMAILSSGNVGIGTILPTPAAGRNGLVVRGSAGDGTSEIIAQSTSVTDGTNSGNVLLSSGTDGYMYNRQSGNEYIGAGNGQQLTILGSNGFVGINKNVPTVQFDVSGTVLTEGGSAGFQFNSRTGSGTNFQWYNPTGADARLFNSSNGDIFTILSNGKVGIGVLATSPTDYLTISGSDGNITIGTFGFNSGGYNGIYLNGLSGTANYNILSRNGDQNLYINRPSGSNILFREANADQILIQTGGDLVSGGNGSNGSAKIHSITTSNTMPNFRAESSSADAYSSWKNTGSGGRDYWWDSGSSGAGVGSGNFAIYDATANTTRFVLNSTGNIGIGSSTPSAQLSVQSNSTSINIFSLATSTGNTLALVDAKGNQYVGGDKPTFGVCGTNPSLAAGSNNNAGRITAGTGVVTACTIIFADAGWTTTGNAPVCWADDESGGSVTLETAPTQTALVITGSTFTGHAVSYRCTGF